MHKMKIYVCTFFACFLSLALATTVDNTTGRTCCCNCNNRSQLNIIYILADDMGWNELSAHGNNQTCTPNLDAFLMLATRLKYFYTHPQCTPSRCALMTGKYSHTIGMQHFVIQGAEPRCCPTNETFLPQYLQRLGYTTHHIGKWHLGSFKNCCRPLQRGFDTTKWFSLGKCEYGGCSYKETDSNQPGKSLHGFNCFEGNEHCYNYTGKYLTDYYTDEAIKIIKSNNCSSGPFFIYLSHLAIHAANDYYPLQAKQEDIDKFSGCLKDKGRVNLTAMVYALDKSIGKLFLALNETGLICNTVVIFTSDNGGTRSVLEFTNGTNCPYRGEKMTAWEGAARVPAAIYIPCLNSSRQGKTYNGYVHMIDWLKTLVCGAAKGNCSMFKNSGLDGLNLWNAIQEGKPMRKQVVITIDSDFQIASIIYKYWKLVCNGSYPVLPQNGMYGLCGRCERQCTFCNESTTVNSDVAKVLVPLLNTTFTEETVKAKRNEYTVKCNSTIKSNQVCVNCSCLFRLDFDPCENMNLASKFPAKLTEMKNRLDNETVMKPLNQPSDSRANPKYYDCKWTNWGDINNVTGFC